MSAIDVAALILALAALGLAGGALSRERRARRLVEDARRRLEGVFEATGFGIIQIDRDARISYANRRAAEILGYAPERLLGHDEHELLHRVDRPEDDGSLVCPLREALHDRRPHFGHDYFRRSDGSRVPIVVSTAPMADPGDGEIVAFRDRSEDVARERESSERFEMLSHELRSPLTSIVGFSRRLQSAVDAGDLAVDDDRAEEIALLAREAERMRDTVTVLLGLARIDTGAVDLDPEPVALRPLVAEEIERARRAAPQLELTLNTDTNVTVETDDRAVRQVVQVLLDNAAKYAGPSPHVEVSLAEDEASALIVITDDGPGIPAELQETLFDRFSRGDAPDAPRGLGLGLHIARQLAYAAGAELTFDAGYTGGARFHLRIPRVYLHRQMPIQRWSW